MKVLLIEDSRRLQLTISLTLRNHSYAVDTETNGEDGFWQMMNYEYDVVILDLMLPDLDGLTLLKRARKKGNETPVIILTAKSRLDDRVEGLGLGADDYMVKPFEGEELLARVEALCRRGYEKYSAQLKAGDLVVDTSAKAVTRAGRAIDLSTREYVILEYLMMRQGQVASRTEIEEHTYDEMTTPMSNVVDSTIYSLRRKLAVDSNLLPLIHTRRGQGYVFELSDQ